jgi:hypothetical protein
MRTAMSVRDGKDSSPFESIPDKVAQRRRLGLIAAVSNPDFLAIALFCVIGLLVALNLMFRFPAFGAVVEQYNQF